MTVDTFQDFSCLNFIRFRAVHSLVRYFFVCFAAVSSFFTLLKQPCGRMMRYAQQRGSSATHNIFLEVIYLPFIPNTLSLHHGERQTVDGVQRSLMCHMLSQHKMLPRPTLHSDIHTRLAHRKRYWAQAPNDSINNYYHLNMLHEFFTC